jgi:hypothetical protein
VGRWNFFPSHPASSRSYRLSPHDRKYLPKANAALLVEVMRTMIATRVSPGAKCTSLLLGERPTVSCIVRDLLSPEACLYLQSTAGLTRPASCLWIANVTKLGASFVPRAAD